MVPNGALLYKLTWKSGHLDNQDTDCPKMFILHCIHSYYTGFTVYIFNGRIIDNLLYTKWLTNSKYQLIVLLHMYRHIRIFVHGLLKAMVLWIWGNFTFNLHPMYILLSTTAVITPQEVGLAGPVCRRRGSIGQPLPQLTLVVQYDNRESHSTKVCIRTIQDVFIPTKLMLQYTHIYIWKCPSNLIQLET